MASPQWFWSWGRASCQALGQNREGASQARTDGPREPCQCSWQPHLGHPLPRREHHAPVSAFPVCLSSWMLFWCFNIGKYILYWFVLVLCFCALVHCDGPEAACKRVVRPALGNQLILVFPVPLTLRPLWRCTLEWPLEADCLRLNHGYSVCCEMLGQIFTLAGLHILQL